jgi:arylsulfatase A-like enzyme
MDPHGPYIPPPGYYDPADEKYIIDYQPRKRTRGDAYKRLYDGECRFMDDLLSPLLPRLAAEPRTLSFVAADHGEEFWEHGKYSFGHGKTVYENLIRVPFFAYVPDREAASITTPISLVDLAPSILAYTGREAPATMQGESFLTPDGGVIEKDRLIFMGCGNFKLSQKQPERRNAVVMWPYKLILPHKRENAWGEYYNLEEDPGETENLPGCPEKRRLRRALKQWRKAARRGPEDEGFGDAAAADLRALGYIQ